MQRLLISTAVATLFFSSLAAQTSSEQSEIVPVMLYPDTDHGTCSIGLRVNAGGAELRAGPSLDYPVIATLEAGHVVTQCDGQDGWDGVIDAQQDEACSIGIMIATIRPYVGPCPSGWIETKSLTGIYG